MTNATVSQDKYLTVPPTFKTIAIPSAIAFFLIVSLIGLITASGLLQIISVFALLVTLIISLILGYFIVRTTVPPQPLPVTASAAGKTAAGNSAIGNEVEQRFLALNPTLAHSLKVFPLQTGAKMMLFGEFFGGTDGWVGRNVAWRDLTYQSMEYAAPVHAYLLVHPQYGPVVVDMGISQKQTQPGYYSLVKGGVTALDWMWDKNLLSPNEELAALLKGHQFEISDVKHVILTHLHEDHVGELDRFTGAVIHVSALEWRDRWRTGYPLSYNAISTWDYFQFDSGPFYTFAASKDIFGDGSVILVPTPGHTLGHVSLLIQMGDYQVCLAGDALYTLRHFSPQKVAAFNYFGPVGFATQADSIKRLGALQQTFPNLIYIPTHDSFDYTFKYLQPFLHDSGRLSPEQCEILRAYKANLYDAEGLLKADAVPYFDRATGKIGAVIP